ncbi:hypothetical protein Pen02_70460 [Plantactinospora endophytica]|uniref:Uncharacterized protein n=1 Tax=Plantactinospora endophytica TaxID=673535 RepID=A0ABQ4EBJ7_9ACTN|nr:hypothetical protein Pen02_70460 [Plantactinospora endophytica]
MLPACEAGPPSSVLLFHDGYLERPAPARAAHTLAYGLDWVPTGIRLLEESGEVIERRPALAEPWRRRFVMHEGKIRGTSMRWGYRSRLP